MHGGRFLSDRTFDAVIVGSGVNGLACAALLSRAGRHVCVLERNDWFGGAIKTDEITVPGFKHDVFSAWHPLWVGGPAHAELGDDLARHGLEYVNTELPTGTLYPDGESAFLLRTADANAAELDRHHDGDGDAWRAMLGEFFPNADLAFGILGTELWSRQGAGLGLKAVRRLGRQGAAEFAGRLLVSARDWLETTFASDRAHGLLAPWVLHTGLGPDAAASGYMAQVIAVAVQEGGMPIPRGGGQKLADALVALIREHGGTCETGVHVERVFSEGVRTADGERIAASEAVICNVTPTQLYGDLLEGFEEKAKGFRYGRSEMQIHYALSEPPRWEGDERLRGTAIVHLTPGLDGVSRAVNEAERGLLPAEATVVVGQPLTMDASRAPDGKGILWIQLQELPWRIKGDAAGEIDVGGGGVDGGSARALRRPDPGADRAAHPQPRDLDPRPNGSVPGGPPGGERQPASRRSVRRLARARPELPLAPSGLAARPSHARARGLADRGEHAPRTRPGRRLGDARGAPAARALPGLPRPSPRPPMTPPLSISQITTVGQSFADDLDAYREAGAAGIGIWEMKLAGDSLERFRESGLEAATAIPEVPSILPLPLMEGPADPEVRIDAICTGIRRLAAFEPSSVMFLTGPGEDRATVVEGIRAIARAGHEAGVKVALEPIQREFAYFWTIASSLDEAAQLLEEADRPEVGLMYDSWHLWNQPLEQIERHRDRIAGVHLADWRDPTRNTNDRVLPGDGVIDFGPIVEALRWEGLYDLEIFSDPELPDSLWNEDPRELARRGVEALSSVCA